MHVLAQLGREQVDVAAVLAHVGGEGCATLGGGGIAHAEVGVVLDLLDGHTQRGVGLAQAEQTLDAGAGLLGAAGVVPPQMLAVVVALVERGVQTVEISLCGQHHRIAQKGEVEVGAEVYLQLACILAGQPGLGHEVIVERLALGLVQLPADADVVLVPFAHDGPVGDVGHEQVGHLEAPQFMSGKHLQPRLGIFVEPFEQGDGQRVAHLQHLRLVVDGVATVATIGQALVIAVGIVALGCLVGLVDTVVAAEVERVDEARHRHVFALHRVGQRVGQSLVVLLLRFQCFVGGRSVPGVALLLLPGFLFGLLPRFLFLLRGVCKGARLEFLLSEFHRAVEAHGIAVGEEEVEMVVAVPVALEHRGYLALGIRVAETLGVGDVVVVGDTAVLRHFLMVGGEHRVHLVAVTDMGEIERGTEVRRALVGVISAGVEVVELESEAELS